MLISKKPRVLVVDDEKFLGELVTRWLTEAGYECEMCLNAASALATMSRTDFDIVLLDINMPGKSGTDLLPELTQGYQDTAVVMMTAVTDTDIAVQAMKEGAIDYVVKPFDLVDLTQRVESALERRTAQFKHEKHRAALEKIVDEQNQYVRQRTKEIKALSNLFHQFIDEDFSTRERKYLEARAQDALPRG